MRSLIFLIGVSLLSSCHTNKNIQTEKSVVADSTVTSAIYRTSVRIDTLLRSTSLDFDTLEVLIERQYADTTECLRLRAVHGSVADTRASKSNAIEHYGRLDSIAYKRASYELVAEHTTSTAVYNPPSGTLILALAIVIAAVLVYLLRKKA